MKASTASLLKRLPVAPALDHLRDWQTLRQMKRRGSFSQYGEDIFVLQYFNGQPGFYLDAGANHPFRISNTYLLYLNGWRGITIEPLPRLFEKHRRYRPNDLHFNVGLGSHEGLMPFYELTPNVLSTFDEQLASEFIQANHAVLDSRKEIPVRTIASLQNELNIGKRVDFLSVDCEGRDLDVLRGVDWSIPKPKLLAVETAHEAVGGEIGGFLLERGYRVLTTRGCNTFFELQE